jgi:hypothetical protein
MQRLLAFAVMEFFDSSAIWLLVAKSIIFKTAMQFTIIMSDIDNIVPTTYFYFSRGDDPYMTTA